MAKEHDPELEAYIFYMDIRAFGKGFDEFYKRAIDEFGIHFINSKIYEIQEDPETHNLLLKYENFMGAPGITTVEMDMVVLSTGMDPASPLSGGRGEPLLRLSPGRAGHGGQFPQGAAPRSDPGCPQRGQRFFRDRGR